ncbi:hypothetical protein [Actinotignum schaalii]|uniref:hypothetical protein n=1 Tax=Actinotignum schaalii TaxID=59505 RepID=UPI0004D0EDD9|nr:hypothetical protein [Actinotignum schaalii]AIE83221.1 hypothetical protein FB03_08240 [Actinotignum schaalii]WQN45421.1 hypothetical protein U4A90_01630 [Actinotignum schaalii]
MEVTHSTKGCVVRDLVSRTKHIVWEVIERATHTLWQHRGNIHIGDINVLRTQVSLEPRTFTVGNRITVFARIHDAFKGVAIAPKPAELDVIRALSIRYAVGSLSPRAFPCFRLIFRHDVTLSCLKLLAGITPVLALPRVKTARDLILNVGTDDFNARNRYVAKTVLEITYSLRSAKVVSLIIKNASVNVAAIFLISSFSPGTFVREHLFNLRTLLIRDIHILRSRLWPRIPRTHISLRHPIVNEDAVGLNKRVHILRFIGVISPDTQTLTSLSSPLMLDA